MSQKRGGLSIPGGVPGPWDRYVRIPSRGREQNTGFSRGFIYGLIDAGAIRSALVPAPGRNRGGVRVVWLADLMDYIRRFQVDHSEIVPGLESKAEMRAAETGAVP